LKKSYEELLEKAKVNAKDMTLVNKYVLAEIGKLEKRIKAIDFCN